MNTLDELERLEKAATPGPWTLKEGEPGLVWVTRDDNGATYCTVANTRPGGEANAALIAAARNALGDLIKIARAVAELGEWSGGGNWDCWCPICGNERPAHEDGCAWVAARALVGGAQ